ncbi:TonB C-terminal domain-containing protein [bacterium]|nr:TonB C-terminal domain-containing protein [bacterium]
MKKKFILLTALLLTGLGANAVNWQPVSTSVPNVDLYIDNDSVRYINSDEYLYAIKYKTGDTDEKVAYIKSNSKTGYIGVIYTTEFEETNYKPNAVFANPHVYMKPINSNSFLKDVHNYAIAYVNGTQIAGTRNAAYTYNKPLLRDDLQVAYNSKNSKEILTPAQLEEYVIKTCKILENNWTPPESGKGTRAIVLLTIGADGSLLNYSFKEASGDNMTDRSILSAVEKTVPYPKFPEMAKGAYSLDFQFVFEHDLLKKSVVY